MSLQLNGLTVSGTWLEEIVWWVYLVPRPIIILILLHSMMIVRLEQHCGINQLIKYLDQPVVVAKIFNPITEEGKAGKSLCIQGQTGLSSEFQESQNYVVRHCLKNKIKERKRRRRGGERGMREGEG